MTSPVRPHSLQAGAVMVFPESRLGAGSFCLLPLVCHVSVQLPYQSLMLLVHFVVCNWASCCLHACQHTMPLKLFAEVEVGVNSPSRREEKHQQHMHCACKQIEGCWAGLATQMVQAADRSAPAKHLLPKLCVVPRHRITAETYSRLARAEHSLTKLIFC